MFIDINQVYVTFEHNQKTQIVLDNISFGIEKGEFVCFLGPSGCGKSTLLNTIAGFQTPTMGSVFINGEQVEKPSIHNLMIFQNYGLLPWKSVLKNVELGLAAKKIPKEERKDIAMKYLRMVDLEDEALKHPGQLSGGMQQRVAIARALAVDPEVLLMDEPFGALDPITRMKLQEDLKKIARETNKTVLFVTHDIEEATFLADRIVILDANPGRIKSIVNVNLHNTDRTSDDFLQARDKVYEAFQMKKEDFIEYYI
ncbi:MAG: ABC transporter ATP-binding protein [Lachnospiraceae bacterium]|nr:ABC transporter ATP-binding protein [Lachnospiraceae bacterium]